VVSLALQKLLLKIKKVHFVCIFIAIINFQDFEYATKSPNKTARKSAVTSREASGRKSHQASGRKSYVNPKSIERMQETDGFGTIKKQIKKNISQGSQKLASKIASIKRIVDDGPKSLRILYDTEEEMERYLSGKFNSLLIFKELI